MNFRELRHRVTFQSPTATSDGQGGREVSWANDFTTFASIKTGSSKINREFEGGKQLFLKDVDVRIRYRSGITPAQRITHDGRVFTILEVHNVEEADKVLLLKCEEEQI
jgi:SPP1 family predicted phage head-tail adaptor